jgi:putrescine transport system substrate-binding protein
MKFVAIVNVGILVAIMFVLSEPTRAEDKVVNIYTWSSYAPAPVIDAFERETGVKVNVTPFDSNEAMEAKLLAGHSGYDIVVPGPAFVNREIRAGLLQPLDKSALPNWKYLDPTVLKYATSVDPDNQFALPYAVYTVGFSYNSEAVAKRLPNAPVDSWAMLFDPSIVSKFADCGVNFLDAPIDIYQLVLLYLKKDPNSKTAADLLAAQQLLLKLRPYIRKFDAGSYSQGLIAGDYCVTMSWPNDVARALHGVNDKRLRSTVKSIVPKEGRSIGFDSLTLLKDAPHPKSALAFMNFVMNPKVAAKIVNLNFNAAPNIEAIVDVLPEIKDNPAIYPQWASLPGVTYVPGVSTTEYDRLRTRYYTALRWAR